MRRSLLLIAALAVPLFACSSTAIGDSCSPSEGCGSDDLLCRGDFPGGLCTQGCSGEGDTESCDDDSVCVAQFRSLLCMPRCQEQSDCREGYQCNGVSGSNIKACQVKVE